MSDHSWLEAIPVTIFREKVVNHYDDAGARASLYDVLLRDLPGADGVFAEDADPRDHPVLHWAPYVSALEKRLIKIACTKLTCRRHERGEDDRDVEKSFGVIVVEIDLLEETKPIATVETYNDIMGRVLREIPESERPNAISPSPSWGGRLFFVPETPVASGHRYEQLVLHFWTLVDAALGAAGLRDVAKVDDAPDDWTRLWKCCKVRGFENKAKPGKDPVWKRIDSLATHEPLVLHDRRFDVEKIPRVEVQEPKRHEISELDRVRVAMEPAGSRKGRALAFLRKMPASVDGDGVTGEDIKAISACWSFGLDKDETLAALLPEWNERCVPPIPEGELLRKITYVWNTSKDEYPWGWRLQGDGRPSDEEDDETWEDEDAEADTALILERADSGMSLDPPGAETPVPTAEPEATARQSGTTTKCDGGSAAHARWLKDSDCVNADDIKWAYRWAVHFNKNRDKKVEPEIPCPDPVDIVQREHTLICTTVSGRSVEWYLWDPESGVYDEVESIGTLLVRTLDDLRVPGLSSRNWLSNIEARLRGRCAISGLERQPCLIDWEKMRATTFNVLNDPEMGHRPMGYPVACERHWYLVAPDGSFERRRYGMEVFLINRLPVDPAAGTPTYTNRWVIERLGEEQAVAFWQWASYCLTPYNTIKRFHMWYGPSDGGKSTAVGVLTMILGKLNVGATPALQLDYGHHRFATSSLRGKLLNISEEDPGYGHTFEKSVKNIAGGGMIHWEIKGGISGEERPTYRLLFTTNEKPKIVDSSEGFSGRMIALLWDRPIPKEKQIPIDEMKSRFFEELPQIIHQCLKTRAVIAKEGLVIPAASRELVREILNESNEVGRWFQDRTKFVPNDENVTSAALYEDYLLWCSLNGEKPTNAVNFHRRIRQLPAWHDGLFRVYKSGSVRGYWGLRFIGGPLSPNENSGGDEGSGGGTDRGTDVSRICPTPIPLAHGT